MKTQKTSLRVQWTEGAVEPVPVTMASGLHILAADRPLRFSRQWQPHLARYFSASDRKRRPPVVLQVL